MTDQLLHRVRGPSLDDAGIRERQESIRRGLLASSGLVRSPDFNRIGVGDLARLFELIDGEYFAGAVRAALGGRALEFKLSSRLTRSGGKTVVRGRRGRPQEMSFGISVSTTLLFGDFGAGAHRPVSASGLVCRDRLDALQRIMEHETTHLIEYLLWEESNCSAARFAAITRGFFGHLENRHRLITPRELALVSRGIQAGVRVRFQARGRSFEGIVNRVTRRATVLVPDPEGEPYSDGGRYRVWYVPVESLELLPQT